MAEVKDTVVNTSTLEEVSKVIYAMNSTSFQLLLTHLQVSRGEIVAKWAWLPTRCGQGYITQHITGHCLKLTGQVVPNVTDWNQGTQQKGKEAFMNSSSSQ